MLGSKYAPTSINEYGAKDINTSLQGVNFTAAAGIETINDFLIADDHLIDGAILTAIGSSLGDFVTCQVIDKNNVIGYGLNVVLGQYVTNWYMNPSLSRQIDFNSNYPAKIFGGLFLRIKYQSVGMAPVPITCNYFLHKILW